MYNEIAPWLSAVEEEKEELDNSAILTGQRSKTNEPELIELFEQNWNSLIQEIEEYLIIDGIEIVSIDNVRELWANDNTILDMNSKFERTLTQEHFQLSERMKGDHLAKEHCLYLSQIFRKHPDHKNLIWRAYKISRSTNLRIMGNSIHTKTKSEIDSFLPKQDNYIKPEVREHIENMIRPPKFPVTLSKIRNEVFQKFDIKYSIHKIRKYIKDELQYTYRKGSSRPCR